MNNKYVTELNDNLSGRSPEMKNEELRMKNLQMI